MKGREITAPDPLPLDPAQRGIRRRSSNLACEANASDKKTPYGRSFAHRRDSC